MDKLATKYFLTALNIYFDNARSDIKFATVLNDIVSPKLGVLVNQKAMPLRGHDQPSGLLTNF